MGIGNTIRCDDGIGAYITEAIEAMHLQNVECLTVHQLQTELVEELIKYNVVILVDAAIQIPEIEFRPLNGTGSALSSSHHINAEMLYAVAEKMFDKKLNIYLCAVKGENFEMGETIAAAVYERADAAISLLIDFIKE